MKKIVFIFLTITLFSGGCSNKKLEINEKYDERIREINKKYDAEIENVKQKWEPTIKLVKDHKEFLKAVKTTPTYTPINRVDSRKNVMEYRKICGQILKDIERFSKQPIAKKLKSHYDKCVTGYYLKFYIPLLKNEYFLADKAEVLKLWMDKDYSVDLESLFALKHNDKIFAFIDENLQKIDEIRKNQIKFWELRRKEEIYQANEDRAEELQADARKWRRLGLVVANALKAYGNALSSGSTYQYRSQPSIYQYDKSSRQYEFNQQQSKITPLSNQKQNITGCSSDFSCGTGFKCVKSNYSFSGRCLKTVDSFGVQVFNLPRSDSIGPKMPSRSDCKFDYQCPIGFKCDQRKGACVK